MNLLILLYVLVSISGAAVLALEILGTRLLGPFFGVSLYLWSALITVTLASLAAGYALGGRWADRRPLLSRLGALFAAAGLWVLIIPWIKHPLLQLIGGMGLRSAVLVSAVVLFAVPLTLLGMITPYALRLKATSVDHVGRDAGNLYAASTIASVVAALATGFWLLPSLGVLRLTLFVGVVLLVGSALAFWGVRRTGSENRRVASSAALLFFLMAAAAGYGVVRAEVPPRSLLFKCDSPYSEVRVLQHEDGRYLLLDGGVHTVEGFGQGESHHRYVPVFESLEYLFDEPGRMLLLGLGGGVVAVDYHLAGWEVDAVEIDPMVVDVARRFFDLKPAQARVHLGDARRFLLETPKRWDLILVDAFGSSSIPFHLVTEEFFALVREHLLPNGVLAMNVEARQWYDPVVASIGKTLRQDFPVVWALPTQEPRNVLGNVVLVAGVDPALHFDEERLPRPIDVLYDDYEHWRVIQMNHGWDNRFDPAALARAEVLTDDRNRIELWSDAVNRQARVQLRETFGDDPALR